MNELALFTGAGGGLLGTRLLGWRPVCGVEIDPYAREVLLRRQDEGHLEPFPVWDDVDTFDGLPWRGHVDVVTGGFPCQPFSVAGNQLAEKDPRNKWPETIRIIREVQPTFAFLENVPGLARHAYFHKILGDLCESGFDAKWATVSAADAGAPHLRKRLWILAYPKHRGFSQRRRTEDVATKMRRKRVCGNDGTLFSKASEELLANTKSIGRDKGGSECGSRKREPTTASCGAEIPDTNINSGGKICSASEVPHANRCGFKQDDICIQTRQSEQDCGPWWEVEPSVGRVVDGMAYRVDQLRCIGNGQVPAVVKLAWELLTGGAE